MSDPFAPRVPLDPETRQARHTEQMRRYAVAQRLAERALVRAHPREFSKLREQARAKVAAERGPLPGDGEEVT